MRGLVFDIKRDSSEDGPGIRTTIFLKGCPLKCHWCHNPEGISRTPSLSFRADKCAPARCGAPCVKACDAGALQLAAGRVHVRHADCSRCDHCFPLCEPGALEPVGRSMTVDDVFHRVAIDQPFFQATGGGVTLSGGEPTQQMAFASALLQRFRQAGIHTAIETCGLFSFPAFSAHLLPYLDLIYFDFKLLDDNASRRYTGAPSRPILDNFEQLLKVANIPVVPRIPLVPGITATEENLSAIAAYLRGQGIRHCALLSYNPLWQDKLKRVGRGSPYRHAAFMSSAEEAHCVAQMRNPAADPESEALAGSGAA
jgi:pyruvate formate lyase activating enzyme